jgi:hypothetical protein
VYRAASHFAAFSLPVAAAISTKWQSAFSSHHDYKIFQHPESTCGFFAAMPVRIPCPCDLHLRLTCPHGTAPVLIGKLIRHAMLPAATLACSVVAPLASVTATAAGAAATRPRPCQLEPLTLAADPRNPGDLLPERKRGACVACVLPAVLVYVALFVTAAAVIRRR